MVETLLTAFQAEHYESGTFYHQYISVNHLTGHTATSTKTSTRKGNRHTVIEGNVYHVEQTTDSDGNDQLELYTWTPDTGNETRQTFHTFNNALNDPTHTITRLPNNEIAVILWDNQGDGTSDIHLFRVTTDATKLETNLNASGVNIYPGRAMCVYNDTLNTVQVYYPGVSSTNGVYAEYNPSTLTEQTAKTINAHGEIDPLSGDTSFDYTPEGYLGLSGASILRLYDPINDTLVSKLDTVGTKYGFRTTPNSTHHVSLSTTPPTFNTYDDQLSETSSLTSNSDNGFTTNAETSICTDHAINFGESSETTLPDVEVLATNLENGDVQFRETVTLDIASDETINTTANAESSLGRFAAFPNNWTTDYNCDFKITITGTGYNLSGDTISFKDRDGKPTITFGNGNGVHF